MARVHLANGYDVIMPQMMTNVNAGELAAIESAAAAAKAGHCQILLTASVESAVDRCMERAKGGDPRLDVISKVIDENGARDFLRELYSQVTQFQLAGSRTQLLTASGSQSNRPAMPSKLHSGRLDMPIVLP